MCIQLQCSPKFWRCPDLWRQQLPVREWAPAPAMQLCSFLKMIGRKAAQVKLRAQAGCRRAALCRAEQHAQHPQSVGLQQQHQLPGAHPLPMAPFPEASLPSSPQPYASIFAWPCRCQLCQLASPASPSASWASSISVESFHRTWVRILGSPMDGPGENWLHRAISGREAVN